MKVGKFTYGHQNITEVFADFHQDVELHIGKFCGIGRDVIVFFGNGLHDLNNISTYPFGHVCEHTFKKKTIEKGTTRGNVIIGNDVWIGQGVTIMSGIKVGDGAIIAANSHVTKTVRPYSVVRGNPAELVAKRFDENSIKKLLEIKWWDWPIDKIIENQELLNSPELEEFIEKHYKKDG